MAVRLPVIQPEPLPVPQTVADCRPGGPSYVRPCPFVASCRLNLLTDVLDDGYLVLNWPSPNLKGADRAFPDKHEADRQWFVEVRLPALDSEKINAAVSEREAARSAEVDARAAEAHERHVAAGRARAERILAGPRARAERVVDAAKKRAAGYKRCRTEAGKASRQRRVAALVAKARDRARAIVAPARALADRVMVEAAERGRQAAERVRERAGSVRGRGEPRIFALGPLDSAACAEEVAAAWTAEHGEGTTRIWRDLPPSYEVRGLREGDVDARFADEAEAAVEYWFDEPRDDVPSCLLDEVAKQAQVPDRGSAEEECLLEEISVWMHVSRERIRQTEETARAKFDERMAPYLKDG